METGGQTASGQMRHDHHRRRLEERLHGRISLSLIHIFGGIYMEFKTPGFGIGGVVAIAAFALFFFGKDVYKRQFIARALALYVGDQVCPNPEGFSQLKDCLLYTSWFMRTSMRAGISLFTPRPRAMAQNILLMVLAPVLGGFAVRFLANKIVEKILPILPWISVLGICYVLLVVVSGSVDKILP